MRGVSAARLAKRAGFWLVVGKVPGVVRVRGDVLEIGPGASDHEVATFACRRELSHGDRVPAECEVRALVNSYGFFYQRSPSAVALVAVRTDLVVTA